MSVNLRNAAARERERLVQERLQLSYVRKMAVPLYREFKQLANKAAEAYDGTGITSTLIIIPEHAAHLLRIWETHYVGVMGTFASRTVESVEEATKRAKLPANANTALNQEIARWARIVAAQKVTGAAKTSKKMIADAVAKVMTQNLSLAEAKKQIRKALGDDVPAWRSRTIAITETHAAAQSGSLTGAKSLGRVMTKIWVSGKDDRTRDSHRSVDSVDLNGKFNVGGASLDHPGDPMGPAEEVVNCRCAMVFSLGSIL